MSLDYTKPIEFHYELAKELSELRKKGFLIIGSGNIVYNLQMAKFNNVNGKPYDWAIEFDETVKKLLFNKNHIELII